MEKLFLKNAAASDVDLIYGWANDDDARRFSFNSRKIPYEDHCRWFEKKLSSPDSHIFILMKNETPIGQCRLDFDGAEALISYFIDKNYRNNGYGKALLRLIREKTKADFTQIKTLRAEVLNGNTASMKVFLALGYAESDAGDHKEYRLEIN